MTSPPAQTAADARTFTMLVARQLDTATTGNGAYLLVLLRAARQAGLRIRIVFAPRRSFGNRPWMAVHPVFADIADEIVVPGARRRGDKWWSTSPIVWGRFAVRTAQEALRRLKLDLGPLTRINSLLGATLGQREARELAAIADATPGDVMVAEYSSLGPVLPLVRRHPRKCVLMHDLFSLRAAAFRARGERPDHVEITLEQEAARVADADGLFYASANEMARIAPLLPKARHIWLRPDAPDFGAVPANDAAPAHALFLGTRHAGNTDALKHLIDDIWPLVRAKAPTAELWVAGSAIEALAPAQVHAPGVKALGRVERLADLGGERAIGLAPTRLASGVSIKVAEYLCLGMSCIAYPVALEGFGDALDDLVDTVDGPQAFADHLLRLLSDPALRQQRAQRASAEIRGRLGNAEAVAYLGGEPPAASRQRAAG